MKNNVPTPLGTGQMLFKQEYIDNLATTTWYKVRNQLLADIWRITPFFDLLNTKGKIKEKVPNGRYWEIPFTYAKADQNQQWFGRGAEFSTAEKELWTRLQYHVKNFGDSLVRYFDDDVKNNSEAKIIDYITELVQNHKNTMGEALGKALWISGGPQAITTLPEIITTAPDTGVIGGIDRSVNPYVRNQVTTFTGNIADELIPTMRTMMNKCSMIKGSGRRTPDIVITTQAIYEAYEDEMLAMGRYEMNNKSRRVDLGLGDQYYKGAEMFWDPDCPDGNMYFLNSDTIEFVYDPKLWGEMTEWKYRYNSLDRYAQIVSRCELCFNNFQKNGVVTNIG